MEAVTTTSDVVQRTTIARRRATEEMHRILFTTREVLALSGGLSRNTLKHWIKRGWIKPAGRLANGKNVYSAWQCIGIVILGTALRQVRNVNSYIGRTAVARAMELLGAQSDEVLLPESQQDPMLAENIAAELSRSALTDHESAELTPEMVEAVARVLRRIDAKSAGMKYRVVRSTERS
jgi:DNA-binding transcriptional MerR regulator